MTSKLKTLLEHAETWSETDQKELAEHAAEIESRRTGVYVISDDEWADLQEGLAQANRREFVSDEVIAAANKRYGI
jgi:hypothetical protein